MSRGYSYSEVAAILLLDEATIYRYAEKYEIGGVEGLLENNYKPYDGYLYDDEIEILCKELDSKIYLEAEDVCSFIFNAFAWRCCINGELVEKKLKKIFSTPINN